ncbi:peptidyl-tRNA hydrolase [Pluteus cervinus]|uniref:Peptidyl-tRNA hydrolase n=1 Tax=Pluteus cervinus TaxID=181527 RepID=A0ACD3AYZ7_9AGAR|nr:peptidyl-tRNA hydrolase [Pluteus cervinus]
MTHLLLVGLGNLPYPVSRHSVGQLVIDALAEGLGIHMSAGPGGLFGRSNVTIGETALSLSLFKSKDFMNVSGPSIASIYRKTVKSPASLVVISDSLQHRPESLKVRLGGSANGHNGVKSIISSLGGQSDFYRFRIGIGRDNSDPADYVMRNLSSHERHFWTKGNGFDLVLQELEIIAKKVAAK